MFQANTLHDWDQYTAQHQLSATEARIIRQRDALLLLTTHQVDSCEQLSATLARILEVAAATLDVARVSIWRYGDNASKIECLDLFNVAESTHQGGASLSASQFPNYFQALAQVEVIAADDACRDPRTAEFDTVYLKPLGITSMLDVPIHLRGEVVGVLCHEHTGSERRWTEDEKAFGVAVSNLISLAFERCERERAESALSLQSAALNAASHAVVITDSEGTLVWANPAFTELTGYTLDEAIGQKPRELLRSGLQSAAFEEAIRLTQRAGQIWHGEVTNRRKDGSLYVEDLTITPVRNASGAITHFVGIKKDLTDHKHLENQFLQAQKMEVVGRLAGGVAHDFNNMLTVINGLAELAVEDLPVHHPIRQDLEQIHESGIRAASLTRQLLAFSRKEMVVRKPLSVATTLTEFRSILQRLIGEDIKLEVHADGAGVIVADASQFEQVVLNLAVNARDAMPMGGTLRIEATDVELDSAAIGVSPGSYVRIEVADSGCGIAPEALSHIFEPFFTTKEAGKGTGLGLATVYSVVQQSGGVVQVASRLGKGTTFTVLLPRVGATIDAAEATQETKTAPTGETILLVEDQTEVRDLAERVLRSAGYRVLVASNTATALKLLRQESSPIDLVVTDVVMPGAGGLELAATAEVLQPGLRVLYTSGYTDDTVLAHGIEQHAVEFLPKPYTPAALRDKVRSILGKPPASHTHKMP